MEGNEKSGIQFVGNRTECALLMLLRDWGGNYKDIRDRHHSGTERIYGFTSERKMASILIRTSSNLRLYNKVILTYKFYHCLQSHFASQRDSCL